MQQIWIWAAFMAFVLLMLALDLGVFHRHEHVVSTREALTWTSVWVTLSMLFCIPVYFIFEHDWLGMGQELTGRQAALQFFSGWITEKTLSLDNIFVIALIFSYFHVRPQFQHRVLFWGILGALLLRGVMIGLGAALIHSFHWILYLFGIILIVTAVRMLRVGDEKIEPERNPLVKLARRFMPVTADYRGNHFFVHENGRWAATPLFLVLLIVESTDVVFAVDSIPAIFGITQDPFLVFTSNIFAILGLRSLFFALASLLGRFRYLKYGLVVVLGFIGVKMLIEPVLKVRDEVSLAIIAASIGISAVISILIPAPAVEAAAAVPTGEAESAAAPQPSVEPGAEREE